MSGLVSLGGGHSAASALRNPSTLSAAMDALPVGVSPDDAGYTLGLQDGDVVKVSTPAMRSAMGPATQTVAELSAAGTLSLTDIVTISQDDGETMVQSTLEDLLTLFQEFFIPSGGLPTLDAATPSNVSAGANVTFTGTYTGNAPWGLKYSIDGAAKVDASAPTIGGGNFSFTLSGLTQMYHKVRIFSSSFGAANDETGYFAVGAAIRAAVTGGNTVVGGTTVSLTGEVSVSNTTINAYFAGNSNTQFNVYFNASPGAAPVSWSSTTPMQVPAKPGTYTFYFRSSGGTSVPIDWPITLTVSMPGALILSWINDSSALSARARSNPVNFQGYYGGGALTSIEYSYTGDGVWRTDATSVVITPDPGGNSGTWSLTIPAPAAYIGSTGFKTFRFRSTGLDSSKSANIGVNFTS